jgi:mannose-6-phosphate isomerase-like protein (cupin superfamily)
MTDLLKLDEAEQALALAQLPTPFAVLFERGDLSVELFAPRVKATQTPHAQDELYIVSSGTATFRRDQMYTEVKVGDLLFVPAGVDHRFERFSDNFRTWVIFFGQVDPVPGSAKSDDSP